MAKQYSVELSKIIDELSLEVLYMPDEKGLRAVVSSDTNRPGLALAGFFEYFDSERIQVLGKSELGFLEDLSPETRAERLSELTAHRPAAIVISRAMEPPAELHGFCERDGVPLLRSSDTTSGFMAALIGYLNVQLASRITNHGVFVEVYGEGVLLMGDSGIGKSETALELIKRGHRLIADDAVEIRRIDRKTLVGSAPELIRYYMELRGIGVINVRHIYGVGAIKPEGNLDLVVKMEPWEEGKAYDRLGLTDEAEEILGVSLPKVTIPVRPGRNLAVIVELAAMNNRQKKMGYNAAEALASAHDSAIDAGLL